MKNRLGKQLGVRLSGHVDGLVSFCPPLYQFCCFCDILFIVAL